MPDGVGLARRVRWMGAFPELAEYYGHPVAHHDALSDNSLSGLAAGRAREDAWLARLGAIDGTALRGTEVWAIHARLRETLESSIGGRICRAELWPAHQFGWQTTLLAVLGTQHPRLRLAAAARGDRGVDSCESARARRQSLKTDHVVWQRGI